MMHSFSNRLKLGNREIKMGNLNTINLMNPLIFHCQLVFISMKIYFTNGESPRGI